MIYFENTQDPQRVRIMRDAPNPGAVPTPGVEYSAGTNIDITANVISVTGLTNYSAGTGIDIQDGVISATGLTPVGYSAGTNIDITDGVISVTGIEGTYVTSGDVKTQIESYDYATESQIPDVSEFVTSGDVKSQIEAYDYATKGDVTAATSGYQETLISGDNIRTINGNSILGSGNLVIAGGQAVSGGNNIEVTEEGVINVIDIISYPGYSAISGDVATQVEAYGYATERQIPDVSEFVTSADVKTQVEAYNYVTSGDVKTQVESYGYATESQIPDVSNFVTSGDVATQVESYNYATTGYVQDAISGITGGTTYNAGDHIQISADTISVTGISSFPGFSSMTKTDVENALGYKPTSSGSVKTQIEAYNYVTSGDVATQVENYHYTTSGDVQSQITGATTGFQETLVSGQNIKTVNTSSLLGSGNLEVGDVRGNGVTGLWTGTQVQYDAITAKSNTVLYFIHE